MATQEHSPLPSSVPGVYDVELYGPAADASRPEVLLEIPHGATAREHFETLRERLRSDLPEGLQGFFHINTDIGAPEVATAVAERLAQHDIGSIVVRSLVPRTFIDCNRALDHPGAGAVTPGLPSYIDDDDDRELLVDLHSRYTRAADEAYAAVCGADRPGFALPLHTFAPRSIALTKIEHTIVEDLRAAYQPGVFETWPLRPEVDLITRAADDRLLAPESLLENTRRHLEAGGFEVKENSTYRLFHATMGYWHSKRWPDRVLCLEMRRDLLAKSFLPFEAMTISADKVARFAGPITEALLLELADRRA